MEHRLVVKQSPKGNLLYCLGSVAMCLLLLFCLVTDLRGSGRGLLRILTREPVTYGLLKLLFLAGLLGFGACALFFCKRMRSGKDVLLVDERGVTDNSSAAAVGLILWADIRRIYIDSVYNQRFIEIELVDADKYLKRLPTWKRKAVEATRNMGHQSVCITLNTTGVTPESVLPKMEALWEHYCPTIER